MNLIVNLNNCGLQNCLFMAVIPDPKNKNGVWICIMNEEATFIEHTCFHISPLKPFLNQLNSLYLPFSRHPNTANATFYACVEASDLSRAKSLIDVVFKMPNTVYIKSQQHIGFLLSMQIMGNENANSYLLWFIDMHQNRWRYGQYDTAIMSCDILKHLRNNPQFENSLRVCLFLRQHVFDWFFNGPKQISHL